MPLRLRSHCRRGVRHLAGFPPGDVRQVRLTVPLREAGGCSALPCRRPSASCGRAALRKVLHASELWEIAAPMLPMWTGAVGGGTRRVARVVRRVAGHRSAVATSYLVRFFTPSRCGRGHSACCPGRLACCRAPVGRCHVVLGTFLHAVGVWQGALDVLPGSSGVLPGSPWLLPDRSRTFPVSSRLLPAPSCTLYFFHRRRAGTTCRASRASACPGSIWDAIIRADDMRSGTVVQCFGPFELDPTSGRLFRGRTRVRLSDPQAAILLRLVAHAGQVVSQEALLDAGWGMVAARANSL